MKTIFLMISIVIILSNINPVSTAEISNDQSGICTFSIVAYDPQTDELGIAVASRFFAVGSVVPWARAGVGAVATQSYANTSFGWRGLEYLEQGFSPEETIEELIGSDDKPSQRQVGIVNSQGRSASFTGENCLDWAGGRTGRNYAIQGNILAGEQVVIDMEKAFLETEGTLSERLYQALLAGELAGGDSRGKQSAAMLVVKEGAGYGGYTDQAIDIRVDDHPEPFKELGRLLKKAQLNYSWNVAWTAFMNEDYLNALPPMERAAKLDPEYAEVQYDLAVIRLAAGDRDGALRALESALILNPKLKEQASKDNDLDGLRSDPQFQLLIEK